MINLILADSNLDIRQDGTIWKKFSYGWRRYDRIHPRSGYSIIFYSHREVRVHRIIYSKFIGDLNDSDQVHHKDGDKQNNIPENLEKVDQHVHSQITYENFQNARGDQLPHTKLDETQAREIKIALKNGEGVCSIAKRYGIKHTSVIAIRQKRAWRHVTI